MTQFPLGTARELMSLYREMNELYNQFFSGINRCHICGAKNREQKTERCRGACELFDPALAPPPQDFYLAVVKPDGSIEYKKDVEVYLATENGFVRQTPEISPEGDRGGSSPVQRRDTVETTKGWVDRKGSRGPRPPRGT